MAGPVTDRVGYMPEERGLYKNLTVPSSPRLPSSS
jgi:ABC-type uncharacterized transport system ATPase subunit